MWVTSVTEAWGVHLGKQGLLFNDGISKSHVPEPGWWIPFCHGKNLAAAFINLFWMHCLFCRSVFLYLFVLYIYIYISLRFIPKDNHVFSGDMVCFPLLGNSFIQQIFSARHFSRSWGSQSLLSQSLHSGVKDKMNRSGISGSDKCYHEILTISQLMFLVRILS